MFFFHVYRNSDKDKMDAQNEIQTIKILERADPSKQESLDSENVPDSMDAEQTWPTEEELKMAEDAQKVTLPSNLQFTYSPHCLLQHLGFLPFPLAQLCLLARFTNLLLVCMNLLF